MFTRFIALFVLVMLSPLAANAGTPKVVVSIAPVHSLVAGVMDGVAEPELLLQGNASPHSYMLKPSQVRSLRQADMVVWVGEGVESFLIKPLASLKTKSVFEVMDLSGMVLLAGRQGGMWDSRQSAHQGHHHDHTSDASMDGHLWLNPNNARVMVQALVVRLSQIDTANADRYRKNGDAMLLELVRLDEALLDQLGPIKKTPYLVFHDAYQYLEQHYGLNAVGSVMVDPERKPGAKRLHEIRQKIQQSQVRCVFAEPQFSGAVTQVIAEGTGLKVGSLDPMGANQTQGKALYFKLMQGLGEGLRACLASL